MEVLAILFMYYINGDERISDETVKQVSGGRNVSLLPAGGWGNDGRQGHEMQQETETLGLYRLSAFRSHGLPTELLGYIRERAS